MIEGPKTLEQTLKRLEDARTHTQNWYASHYGKLEDWARKRLPEPWCNEFFSCIANGTWGHADVGERYRCNAGFDVVPSGYIHMDDAKGQLILDQTRRAEEAELRCADLERRPQEVTAKVWTYTWDTDCGTGTRVFKTQQDAFFAMLDGLDLERGEESDNCYHLISSGQFDKFMDWYSGWTDRVSSIDHHSVGEHTL